MELVQVLGQQQLDPSAAMSVATENSQSQTISTLSSGILNLLRCVEKLVEMQKRKTEAIVRGFDLVGNIGVVSCRLDPHMTCQLLTCCQLITRHVSNTSNVVTSPR